MPNYWLLKSEPTCYSIDDLAQDGTTFWDGVRNYQARNFLRDAMKPGDLAFYYHSSTAVPAIVGLAEISGPAYPDPTAFDPSEDHYDPDSAPDKPRWYVVDVTFKEKFAEPLPLTAIKADPALAGIPLTQTGSRLSVQPMPAAAAEHILRLVGAPNR